MTRLPVEQARWMWVGALACVVVAAWPVPVMAQAAASGPPVYRCPGNPVLYTDALSAKEAKEKGCRTLEGAPITVIQAQKPRVVAAGPAGASGNAGSRPQEGRIEPAEQRSRDTDSKRILEAELRKDEDRLAALQKEYNSGEPERRGDERNYQKYLDRVTELKSGIARKEADIVAIKREIGKLPQ